MRNFVAVLVFALVAAPAFAQTTPAPAPAPEGAVTVSVDQNGAGVDASVGGQLAIQLQRNGSIGTSWALTAKPDFLGDPSQLTGPTVVSARPIPGSSNWQVFVFAVNEAGSGDVTLEKHDRSGATIETFTVTITAQ